MKMDRSLYMRASAAAGTASLQATAFGSRKIKDQQEVGIDSVD